MIPSFLVRLYLLLLASSALCLSDASGTEESGHSNLRPVGFNEDFDVADGASLSDYDKSNLTIVNGQNATLGEYPWYVAFPNNQLCGGSLIAPDRVLTSATCITTPSGVPPFVRVGALTTSDGVGANVSCAIVHPGYNRTIESIYNDIAILELETPITNVGLAPFNMNPDAPDTARPLIVMGLGLLGSAGPSAATLQAATVDLLPLGTCQQSFPDGVILDRVHICSETLNTGFCTGDGGVPLMDQATGVQVGIASFTYGSCGSTFPDVYTDVGAYSGWIRGQLTGSICPPPPTSAPTSAPTGGCFFTSCCNSVRNFIGGIF